MNYARKTTLKGLALCKVEIGTLPDYVITMIEVPAFWISDLQFDGGVMHDEGYYDYDIKTLNEKAEVCYPLEYRIVEPDMSISELEEHKRPIAKILEVLKEDLQEDN